MVEEKDVISDARDLKYFAGLCVLNPQALIARF